MILDKELELLDKKAVTNAAVTGDAVKLGKTVSANPCVIVLTGEGLAGGTALTVAVETADDEAMTDAETLATFTRAAGDGVILQAGIPFDVKEYVRLKVTPKGTFTAGTVSAFVAYGPQIGI